MTEPTSTQASLDAVWKALDNFDASVEVEESLDEAKQYGQKVGEEIQWKIQAKIDPRVKSRDFALTTENQHEQDPQMPDPGPTAGGITEPLPSFNPSSILQTSTPQHLPAATFPYIPTPSQPSTARLPQPQSISAINDTPTASRLIDPNEGRITTPSFTPQPSRTLTIGSTSTEGEGRGKRDPPDTPVPIGTPILKGKKDFAKLTKHFELFSKQVSKAALPVGQGQGQDTGFQSKKRLVLGKTASTGLGGRIFEGLRFCIPPELNQESKHKTRWGVIAGLAGVVVLQPDTAITHVICDPPKTASALARDLGLELLSELPEGTVCVKWDWVVKCKMAGKVLEATPWLSFPRPNLLQRKSTSKTLLPVSSRIFDITDQLRGKSSSSINRKREHTASESETDSQKRPPPQFPIPAIPPPRKCIPSTSTAGGTSHVEETKANATRHALPEGPGWIQVDKEQMDGLDEMITGVVEGKIVEEDTQGAEEDDDKALLPDLSGDADPSGSKKNDRKESFKCAQPNNGKSNQGPNEWLAVKFEEMFNMYEGMQGKSNFAIQGYRKAAGIMRRTTYPIVNGEQALKIRGIGSGMADRIDEFISGGPGRAYYEDNDKARSIRVLKDVYGVGKTVANELYKRGARTIEDLTTKEFGLNPAQKIGVELYDDLTTRIPREECKQIYEIIREEALGLDSKLWIEIMGSYRRGQESSGDVDILITRDTSDGITHAGVLPRLIKALKMRGTITHDLSTPHDPMALEAKWMGVCKVNYTGLHRRLDILCIPFEQWGACLIFFTGNEVFNRSLRLYARKMGYSLNQRGLSTCVIRGEKGQKLTEGEIVASRSEQEIFDVLGIRWRPPHQRRP